MSDLSVAMFEGLALAAAWQAGVASICLAMAWVVARLLREPLRRKPKIRRALGKAHDVVRDAPLLAQMAPLVAAALGAIALDLAGVAGAAFVLGLGVVPVLALVLTEGELRSLARLDPAILDSAKALGMSGAQVRRMVEGPLAAADLLANLRSGAIWSVTSVTLLSLIGFPGLGQYVFGGLARSDLVQALAGLVAVALLASAVSVVLVWLEAGLRRRVFG